MDDLSGTVVDKYRLVRLLGKGGMGVVYEARHELIGRPCAVKLLHPDVADEEIAQRMLREARAAAAIGHTNIVDALDFGVTAEGVHYMVMELLAGESLGAVVKRCAPLPLEPTAAVVIQVLEALGAAHAAGVVHRDLKPDNVFILQKPRGSVAVKLLDFGISLFRTEGAEAMRLTKSGAVMGTPFYMSPEQAEGAHRVDGRADLWSVGVLFYEALTGVVPFAGNTFSQVILKIVINEHEPIGNRRPDLPPVVAQLIDRTLAKQPEHRFQSAEEMLVPLRALVSSYQPGPGGILRDLRPEGAAPVASRPAPAAASSLAGSQPGLSASVPASLTPIPPTITTSSGQVVGRQSRLEAPRGKFRSGLFLAVWGGAAALIAVTVFLIWGRTADKKNSTSKETSAPTMEPARQPHAMPSTAAMPEVPLLRVKLVGLPPAAEVKMDGQVVSTPLTLRGDNAEHTLQVSAPGHTPVEQRFVAHAALRSITIRLSRRPRPTATAQHPRRAEPPKHRRAAPSRPRPQQRARPRPGPRPRPRTTRRGDWAL